MLTLELAIWNLDPKVSRKLVAAFALMAVVAIPIVLIAWVHSSMVDPLRMNQLLPSVQLTTMKGGSISFPVHLNKPVACLVFSADCPHCQNELLHFESLNQQYKSDVSFVAVSTSSETETAVLDQRFRYTFEILVDKQQRIRNMWRIGGVPNLFLLDEHGIIKVQQAGETLYEHDEAMMKDFIARENETQLAAEREHEKSKK